MSMLGAQIKGLREAANWLDEIGISMGHDTTASAFIAHDVSERMHEAAGTIESLRNTLQELQGVGGESRYTALFGTPEKAAQTLAKISCDGSCDSCALYGAHCDYSGKAQLKWLKGNIND